LKRSKQAVLQTGVLTTTIYFCTIIGALPVIHEVFSPQKKHVRVYTCDLSTANT